MHRSTSAVLAVLMTCAGVAQAADACLQAADPQTLSGNLHSIDVYGAKRYGAKPAKDQVDTLTLLVLDKPACVAVADATPTNDVRALQVEIDAARWPTLRALVGRHVAIEGRVRAAANPGDRAAFVVDAASVAEAPGGNRLLRAQPADLLARGRVPVMIGSRGPKAVACTGVAHLAGSSPGMLRERGSNAAGTVASIGRGDTIHLCEISTDGEWFGVVAKPARKSDKDYCGVSAPIAAPQAYRGRCVSGWLRTDEVLIEAG